jgi:hypothetical protein
LTYASGPFSTATSFAGANEDNEDDEDDEGDGDGEEGCVLTLVCPTGS